MWLFYFLVFYMLMLAGILNFINNKELKSKLYLILSFGPFLFLASLRSINVGNDTDTYISLFQSVSSSDELSGFLWRYETGYIYYNKFLSLFTSNPQILLIVTSIFLMWGFGRFIYKYSELPWLSVYLFFTMRFFDTTMNTLRQDIALIILLLSFDKLIKKKNVQFVILVLFASQFHNSAIVFLLAWPLSRLKFNLKNNAIIVAVSAVAYFGFNNILYYLLNKFPLYQYYIGTTYLDGETRLASIMNLLIVILIILFGVVTGYYQNKGIIKATNEISTNKTYLWNLIAAAVFLLISLKFSLLGRVASYFQIYAIVLLPNTVKGMRNKKIAYFCLVVIVVLFFCYSLTIQILRPDWNRIYPFEFFWQNVI